MTTVLVLREGVHGMQIEEYAAALRERLPDHEVRLARTRAQERDLVADAEVVTSVRGPAKPGAVAHVLSAKALRPPTTASRTDDPVSGRDGVARDDRSGL